METHVKVLGVLHIALGALGLLCAILMMVIFGSAAGIIGATGDPDAQVVIPIIGLAGGAVVVLLLILSLPGLITGIGLLKFRQWARILGIVLSVLDLVMVPIGTIVGVYGLWVLLSKDTEPLFRGTTTPAM